MAQETHYYNNVIAQLVELRDETKKGNEESQTGITAKLDEVIDAIEKIQVTAENIKIEAGTINLSTDEVEALLKTVNTNLGIINDNINEFNTNVQTELVTFTNAIKDEFIKLIQDNTTKHTTLNIKLTDEFTKLNKTISDKIDENKVLNETKFDTYGSLNHSDLLVLKAALDTIKTTIETELNDLQTGSDTNKNDIITKLETIISTIGNVSSPVEGSVASILNQIKISIKTIVTELGTATSSPSDVGSVQAKLRYISYAINTISNNIITNKDDIVEAIKNSSSTGEQTNAVTNQLITDIKTIVDNIKTNNGTDTQSIIDAINAIKVTADNIKIDASTINLSTDEVEGLLKTGNTTVKNIYDSLIYTRTSDPEYNGRTISELVTMVAYYLGDTNVDDGGHSIAGKLRELVDSIGNNYSGDLNNTVLAKLEKVNEVLHSDRIISNSNYTIHDLLSSILDVSGTSNDTNGNSIAGRLYALMDLIGDNKGINNPNYIPKITILNSLDEIKNAINNQTTSITEAMTSQTNAIVEAINNITGNGTYKVVMVEDLPPQFEIVVSDKTGKTHNVTPSIGKHNFILNDTIIVSIFDLDTSKESCFFDTKNCEFIEVDTTLNNGAMNLKILLNKEDPVITINIRKK